MNDTLHFYGKLVGENRYIPLFKYCTSTKLSKEFCKYMLIPCANIITKTSDGAKITEKDLINIMEELSRDNEKNNEKLAVCYKYRHMVQNISKIMDEINELKTIINDNNDVINFCSVLCNILNSSEGEDGIEELYLIIN